MDFGTDFRFQSVREGLGARLNYDEFCDKIVIEYGGNESEKDISIAFYFAVIRVCK